MIAVLANAQFGGHNGGNNYYGSNGDGDSNGNNDNSFGRAGLFGDQAAFIASKRPIIIAHAVLAAAAFVFFFPVGSILIRLGNFRGLWLVHAAIQVFAYILYIAAFAIGVYITTHAPLINNAHPIIGIVLFILLFFQPILGFLHHVMFRKHSRRVVWSYGHIWLGRIIITLGIINGGLGLQLAQRVGIFAPSNSAVIAYSVVAAVMWLAYVIAAVIGERRRRQAAAVVKPPAYKESTETLPGAPRGVGEYYSKQESGQVHS